MNQILLYIILIFILPLISLSQETKLVLPIGHTDGVNSAQFSPDGRYIVTASEDATARIWEVATGKLLHILQGHKVFVNSAQFSPDGQLIVTAGGDYTVKIWDVPTGMLLHDLKGHTFPVNSALFSPDGKWIVSASDDSTAMIWELTTGERLNTFQGHTDGVNSAQFSPDGKWIITASKDYTAKMWNAATGELLHNLQGHTDYVNIALISADGQWIVTASEDNTAKIWNAATGELIRELQGYKDWPGSAQYSPDGKQVVIASWDPYDSTAIVIELATGNRLHTLHGHSSTVNSAQFSPDGQWIVTASWDGTAKIWDATTGILKQSLQGHTNSLKLTQSSSNGQGIVTVSDDQIPKIWVWETATGQLLHYLQGHTDFVNSVQFSPDGRWIVTSSWDKTAKIWDVSTGQLLHDLQGHTDNVESAQFSPEGQRILTTSDDETAKLWEVATGNLLIDLQGHKSIVKSAQFSPNGQLIVTASWDETAKIWDVSTGQLLHDLQGHTDNVESAQFSPDGQWIVTASWDGTAKIWDASTGKLLLDLIGHTHYVTSAQFSPNGQWIITSSYDGTSKIYEVSSGSLLSDLKRCTVEMHTNHFSPKGQRVIVLSSTPELLEMATGRLLLDFQGHKGNVESVQFSTDGKYIITTGDDKTIIWDAETGKILYTRLQLTNGDWLVYDEHYRYDGSPGARDYLYFTCGLEVIDLAQMKDALYVPGLAEIIMNGQDINYPKLSDLEICGALPLVEKTGEGSYKYSFSITQRALEVDRAEVYVNDKIVKVNPVKDLEKKSDVYYLNLEEQEIRKHFLPGEENKVKVIAVVKKNGSELKSRGVTTLNEDISEDLPDPKLFAIMIGINDYKDDRLDLNFPAKDASDLSATLEMSAGLLLGKENVFVYNLNNGGPSEVFTTPEKEGIKKALAEIGTKAEPQDVIILFFAGHGSMVGEEEKKFTLLTAESSNLNPVGITMDELIGWLSYEGSFKILANKTILVFDACQSGQATEELLALARSDEETKRIRQVEDLRDKTGMFILAASAPDQNAYELPQYGHGLLTYSLLVTLKNNPEVLDDGKYLNVQKWFLESEEYLQDLTESLGYQQNAQPFGTANIRIGEVNDDVRNNIPLAREKPVIICANVMNLEAYSDDLKIKEKVNEFLNETSSRSVGSEFVYSTKETSAVNKINVLYSVEGESIVCQVKLVKKGEELYQTEISGRKPDIGKLVEEIVNGVVVYAE